MQDNKVIEELGDGKGLADALNATFGSGTVSADQVYAWKSRNRIPPEWRPRVADVAAGRIKKFDREMFIRSVRPRKPRKSVTSEVAV